MANKDHSLDEGKLKGFCRLADKNTDGLGEIVELGNPIFISEFHYLKFSSFTVFSFYIRNRSTDRRKQ